MAYVVLPEAVVEEHLRGGDVLHRVDVHRGAFAVGEPMHLARAHACG